MPYRSAARVVVAKNAARRLPAAPSPEPDDQASALGEEFFAGLLLEFAPDFVRPKHQRHICLAFADGLPGDAGFAMRRAADRAGAKAVNADDLHAATSQLIERRRSHGTKADHRNVISLGTARHRNLLTWLSHRNQNSRTSRNSPNALVRVRELF